MNDELVTDDIVRETEQVFTDLAAVLAAAGTDLGRVVKTTLFLTDMGLFGKVNEVYARCFREPSQVRSTVQVAALPKGVSVRIEVTDEV
jgi:2-iminobutanoate/2-iminopropanoate deaminase